jgi:predicted ATPase
VLHGLHRFYLARAELQTSRDLAEQCLDLAQRQDDSILLVPAHRMMGTTLFFLGEFVSALEHFERGIALYDAERHRSYALLCGQDEGVGCRGYSAWALWDLGYPDQALARSREALALAQTLSHPYSLAYALILAAWVHQFRCEVSAVQELVEAAISLSTKQGFAFWLAFGTVLRGWALVEQGQAEAGVELIYQGWDITRAMGIGIGRPHTLSLLAEARVKMGQIEEALTLLDEALVMAHENGEACSLADLYIRKGEYLLSLSEGNQAKAEACFLRAFEIALQQRAKLSELRAATSLSRLWWSRGEGCKARQLLAQTYGWFSEGFDVIYLREAKALLDALS